MHAIHESPVTQEDPPNSKKKVHAKSASIRVSLFPNR